MKRFLDIILSASLLVVLTPLMIVCAIVIMLESPGAPVYVSQRIGRDFRRFNFYKFRSMRPKADGELEDLKGKNSYLNIIPDPENVDVSNDLHKILLYSDNYKISEYDCMREVQKQVNSCFIKVENDPRITKFGKFIRKTSIDELPQLWNILKGDMSFVGNRPLSIAEAELLTSDRYAKRFDCAAGLTGLWQTRKDKDNMSPSARRDLDVEYAENNNLWYDIKLFLYTFIQILTKNNE